MVIVFGDASGHMDNITASKSISVEEFQEESNLITVDIMVDNNDMPSTSTLETQQVGESGGNVSAIIRDGNDITQGNSSNCGVQNKVLNLSSLSLILTVEQYG